MREKGRVELLSPAGSPEGFYGAVHAGADAVYLGGSRFGARAYAENFTQEELVECIRYARLFGVKVYLAVNTLLKEKELEELEAYLTPYCEAGLDGVIVQDLGVLRRVRERFPGLPLHASTQMSVCSGSGAALLKEMGVSRIVPARELSLAEIIAMKEETGLELETFVHGAMCYCYSGQCLFSSILGGRSGNRGRCAQPCRLPYQANGKTSYLLSMKDLCTIGCLPLLLEAGIDSFKIEGRMKKPEYAAGVTAIYRKYIERYQDLLQKLGKEGAREAYRVDSEDEKRLNSLYIRSETQEGYYFQKNGRQMITVDSPAYRATESAVLTEIRRQHLEERPRLPVEIEAEFLIGMPACVTLRRGKACGRAVGVPVQAALKNPVTEADLKKQLGRLGDSPFEVSSMKFQLSQDAFYPLKGINELRRQAVQALEKELLDRREDRPIQSTTEVEKRPTKSTENTGQFREPGFPWKYGDFWTEEDLKTQHDGKLGDDHIGQQTTWAVSVTTLEQLEALVRVFLSCGQRSIRLARVYLDGDLVTEREKETLAPWKQIRQLEAEPFLAMPYVFRRSERAYLENLCRIAEERGGAGFLARSVDGLGALWERGIRSKLRTDAGIYVWNSGSAEVLSALAEGFCLPYELKASEQRSLLEGAAGRWKGRFEKILYSRIPMMVTANCVKKTSQGCQAGQGGIGLLTDRYRKTFPVRTNCLHCTNLIYNSLPFALPEGEKRWRGLCDLRLDFTLETGRETEQVLKSFWLGEALPETNYTSGLEKRGVE